MQDRDGGNRELIQKAVVLCAGEGSRLRPLTFSRPKHLLPVAGKPILGWALEALRDAGVRQVGLVVGHLAEAVRRYVGDGEAWGLQAEYIPQLQPLGLAHAVLVARDFVGDDPFLVYLGDNLFQDGLGPFVEGFAHDAWDAGLLLKWVEDPSRFGVAQVEGNRVTAVVEKPTQFISPLAIVGVYAFRSSIFDAICRLEPSARGELEITDAIELVIEGGGHVGWGQMEGLWEDAGEPMALLRANHHWLLRSELTVAEASVQDCRLEGPLGIESGARVVNSHLIGPCRISRGCVVRDSTIGPDVAMDEGCEVSRSHLRNCIVQRNTRISGMQAGLVDSVLGEQVTVTGPDQPDTGTPLSLLMGDMSHLKAT